MGVSMLLPLLPPVFVLGLVLPKPLLCVATLGGGGRAKGFGGPWAPALKIAPAEGDGGGRTTPVGGLSLPLAEVTVLFPADSRSEDSAVALPWSELSLGIWTFNWGRFVVNAPLLVRDGGLISDADEIDCARAGSVAALMGTILGPGESSWVGCVLGACSPRGDSYTGAPAPKWRARTDPRSSIGVKILRDLDRDFRCGGDWLFSGFSVLDV